MTADSPSGDQTEHWQPSTLTASRMSTESAIGHERTSLASAAELSRTAGRRQLTESAMPKLTCYEYAAFSGA